MSKNASDISRRTFVKAGIGVVGTSTLGGVSELCSSARGEQAPALVVSSSAPILSPDNPKEVVARSIEQLRQGGISCALGAVATIEDWPTTMEKILAYSSFLQSSYLVRATSANEIATAAGNGKIAIVYHCQGSFMLGSPFGASRPMVSTFNIKRIAKLHELGVRVMQITDDYKGYLGDGCAERTDCGLTDYGMWAVRTMNEVGMLIDCSQTGHQTSLDTINLSTRPVIFSRSNAKSLCPAKRNISDEQIQAVAAKGGVIGVTAEAELVDASAPNLEGFLAHIDYIARLAGIEHVGLGLGNSPDATAASETPQFSVIAKGLTVKRYSEQAIRKIGGENFVRVFRQAWGD